MYTVHTRDIRGLVGLREGLGQKGCPGSVAARNVHGVQLQVARCPKPRDGDRMENARSERMRRSGSCSRAPDRVLANNAPVLVLLFLPWFSLGLPK